MTFFYMINLGIVCCTDLEGIYLLAGMKSHNNCGWVQISMERSKNVDKTPLPIEQYMCPSCYILQLLDCLCMSSCLHGNNYL